MLRMRRFFLLFFLFATFNSKAQEFSTESLGLKAPEVSNCTPVKDQFMSSTCWAFSSISLLESESMRSGMDDIDLSEMFIARYSMIRKIERHLALRGTNYFTPGGQFHDVMWVVKNYGLLPEEVYPGRPHGESKHNHMELDTLLSRFVKSCVQQGITVLSKAQRLMIDSLLDNYLGKVPAEFEYKGRKYTPLSFARDYLRVNTDDYVEITSYTHHPFYESFVLEDKYNWTGDKYYNVPIADFTRITDNALENGFTVGWDGDADDLFFDYYAGLAFMPRKISNPQKERQEAFTDGTTLLNHMMHIVGMTTDNAGQKWYYIKNSWGETSNELGGYLFMRADYFQLRTVAIIVNKNAIPADISHRLSD